MGALLHQLAALLYLGAGAAAAVGLSWPSRRLLRAGTGMLAIGVVVHGSAFAVFHLEGAPPPLTDLSATVSFMAFVGVLFFLALEWRMRIGALVAGIAPVAAVSTLFAALRLPHVVREDFGAGAYWPHAHVLLASAGLSFLGVACLAGLAFLYEDRRLKAKRPARGVRLPSLEALDRVNGAALAAGFPLLTVGVLTGLMWNHAAQGRLFTGHAHETLSFLAWIVYGALVVMRFRSYQVMRQAALSAVGGFALLLVAVIGVELLT
ncbi:MAG TPA: cytochrome c biogenesis protein CcsA [Myxococcota bacterium]|nr:cytochrome c biogenesis protein CcsA [Myxococcota bacterium]